MELATKQRVPQKVIDTVVDRMVGQLVDGHGTARVQVSVVEYARYYACDPEQMRAVFAEIYNNPPERLRRVSGKINIV